MVFLRNFLNITMPSCILIFLTLLLQYVGLPSKLDAAESTYSQWQLPEGAKMRLGKGEINDIKFSPDGSHLAVATSIGIWIYDVKSLKEITFMRSDRYTINAISYIDNGELLISASERGPMLSWKLNIQTPPTKPIMPSIPSHSTRLGFAMGPTISPNGKFLANGSMGGSITLYDLQGGQRKAPIKAHSRHAFATAFSFDGSTLITGGEDGKIHFWDVNTQKRQQTLTESSSSHSIAISQDGKMIANGNFGGGLFLWDIETKQKIRTFKGHTDAIQAVTFSPDGKIIASGSWDTTIRLWDTDTGNQIGIIKGHPHFVEQMAFAPNGNFAAGTSRGVISLWDIKTGREKPTQNRNSYGLIRKLGFSDDSQKLFNFAGDKLTVTDVATNKEVSYQTIEKHKAGYPGTTFSPDKSLMAIRTTDRKIALWNVSTGDEVLKFRSGFKEAIIDLTFSADAEMLAGAGIEGDIRLWDTKNGRRYFTLTGHTKRIESLAFSPDGKLLASGSWDGTLRLWDLGTRKQTAILGNSSAIIAVIFSLDSNTVVSTNRSNRIQLWNARSDRNIPIATLSGHNGWIRNLEFSSDGKTLASGSDDGIILLWDWEKCTQSIRSNLQ